MEPKTAIKALVVMMIIMITSISVMLFIQNKKDNNKSPLASNVENNKTKDVFDDENENENKIVSDWEKAGFSDFRSYINEKLAKKKNEEIKCITLDDYLISENEDKLVINSKITKAEPNKNINEGEEQKEADIVDDDFFEVDCYYDYDDSGNYINSYGENYQKVDLVHCNFESVEKDKAFLAKFEGMNIWRITTDGEDSFFERCE